MVASSNALLREELVTPQDREETEARSGQLITVGWGAVCWAFSAWDSAALCPCGPGTLRLTPWNPGALRPGSLSPQQGPPSWVGGLVVEQDWGQPLLSQPLRMPRALCPRTV